MVPNAIFCNCAYNFRCAKIDPALQNSDSNKFWLCLACRLDQTHVRLHEDVETNQCVNITEFIDENKSLKAIIECLKLDIQHLNWQISDKCYACKTKSNPALVDEKWKCTSRQFKPSRIIDDTAATKKDTN